MKKHLTRAEAGKEIFRRIKADVESRQDENGKDYVLGDVRKTLPYPVCRATIYKAGAGDFDREIFVKLPFLGATEYFTFND